MKVIAPHLSCICDPSEFQEVLAQGYKEIYIITSKGIIKHHQLRGENRFVRLKVDSIPGYVEEKITESVNFLPAGKIPYAIFDQVIAFFKKVMAVKNAELEAMIHVLWNPTLGYHLGVPPQTISKASVNYDWSYIPEGTSIILDIHSHNTMGAFFSGTDNNDDKNNISFSGVVGKINDKEPATVWRFNYYNTKYDAKISDLFEIPERELAAVPDEWIDKVKTQTYQTYKYGGSKYNANHIGGSSNQGNALGWTASEPANKASGKSWDHLKEFQFPKGNGKNFSSSNDVTGSETPMMDSHVPGFNGCNDVFPDEYERGFQGSGTFMGHAPTPESFERRDAGVMAMPPGLVYDVSKGRYTYTSSESQGSLLEPNAEDETFSVEGGGDPVVGKSEDAMLSPAEIRQLAADLGPGSNSDRFDELAINHGAVVAESFMEIDFHMGNLAGKDNLISDLATEMVQLMSDEGQTQVFHALYANLSPREKERIATFGLNS